MSNDLIQQPSATSTFLESLNIPKIIAGPAGEALSRLIAGTFDIPHAWIRRVSQSINDKTEAKSLVSRAIAEAAANLAKNDSEIVHRAAHALLLDGTTLSKHVKREF